MARNIDYAKIPMGKNDIGAKTIGEYFEKLLLTLWDEQEDFSGKRPFGNGGWEYDVYASLISAGVVDGSLDEEGYVNEVSYSAANNIICEMIKQIFATPTADVVPKKEIANVLSDLKIAVHNKAHYNHAQEVPTYITIRELDAILNNFIQNRKDVQNGR